MNTTRKLRIGWLVGDSNQSNVTPKIFWLDQLSLSCNMVTLNDETYSEEEITKIPAKFLGHISGTDSLSLCDGLRVLDVVHFERTSH